MNTLTTEEIEIDLEADVPTVRYNDEAYRAKIFRQASEEANEPITQRGETL